MGTDRQSAKNRQDVQIEVIFQIIQEQVEIYLINKIVYKFLGGKLANGTYPVQMQKCIILGEKMSKENERTIQKDKQDKFKYQALTQFMIMSSATVESIRINSRIELADCYLKIGPQVTKPRHILPQQELFEQINFQVLFSPISSINIELWKYQPQQMVERWTVATQLQRMSEQIYFFKDENWKVLIKIRTIPSQISDKFRQTPKSDSLKQDSTKSNSRGKNKTKSKGAMSSIKKALRQRINLLVEKPQPKTYNKDRYHSYYSSSTSKYPSFFTNHSQSSTQINQTWFDYCAQKLGNEYYNSQAQNIYGFVGPKQQKVKHASKQKFQPKKIQNIY